MDIIESFKTRLSKALSISGLTQAELARKSGIHRQIISDYLKGKYDAKQDKILKLSKALNVNAEWLLGYNDGKSSNSEINFTDRDIDKYFNNIHYYKGQKVNEMQRKFMRNSIKSFLEIQLEMTKDHNNKKQGD
ncbi:helix-turn-helix domain-containing protein [Limosilactobacillus reuteri]|uniref:helix-turn-helix domain-containing protein n=1 Tax=Limosilactobacillus reuteri TaxID=1598 RepID=UPI00214AF2F0